MKDKLIVKGIREIGHHGVFESERLNGQEFVVDVEIEADFEKLNDDLSKTIDYSKIIDLVSNEISSNPVNLIETLANRIALRVLEFDKKIKKITITVHKPAAPVSANVSDIVVSVSKKR